MTSDTFATVMQRGESVFDAATSRRLQRAITDFIAGLRTIRDGLPDQSSADQIAALQSLAERVIDRIEDHLADASDRNDIQLGLAVSVYAIRRSLEEIVYWHKHYTHRPAPIEARDHAVDPVGRPSERPAAATNALVTLP
jgi:hypothetical protein